MQSLMTMVEHKRVQLIWMAEHTETADSLAKWGPETPITGPKLACDIPGGPVR